MLCCSFCKVRVPEDQEVHVTVAGRSACFCPSCVQDGAHLERAEPVGAMGEAVIVTPVICDRCQKPTNEPVPARYYVNDGGQSGTIDVSLCPDCDHTVEVAALDALTFDEPYERAAASYTGERKDWR